MPSPSIPWAAMASRRENALNRAVVYLRKSPILTALSAGLFLFYILAMLTRYLIL
jgi:hypothetical protein